MTRRVGRWVTDLSNFFLTNLGVLYRPSDWPQKAPPTATIRWYRAPSVRADQAESGAQLTAGRRARSAPGEDDAFDVAQPRTSGHAPFVDGRRGAKRYETSTPPCAPWASKPSGLDEFGIIGLARHPHYLTPTKTSATSQGYEHRRFKRRGHYGWRTLSAARVDVRRSTAPGTSQRNPNVCQPQPSIS